MNKQFLFMRYTPASLTGVSQYKYTLSKEILDQIKTECIEKFGKEPIEIKDYVEVKYFSQERPKE